MPEKNERALSDKIISLETNYYCNLNCVHCYLPRAWRRRPDQVELEQCLAIFDQLADGGFSRLQITGGEPLLHPQFSDIYQGAWDRGFFIALYTNGQLIDEPIIDLFKAKPPAIVQVSLYGADRDSYREISGKDGFERAYGAVARLQQADLPVSVKIPLLRQNKDSVLAINSALERMGVTVAIDIRIFPRLDGSTDNLRHRLSPEEIVDFRLENVSSGSDQDGGERKPFKKELKRPRSLRYCLEECQPYLINPRHGLQMCYFLREFEVDLRRTCFSDALQVLMELWNNEEVDYLCDECRNCNRQVLFSYCPGWAKCEVGRAGDPIPFFCRLQSLYSRSFPNWRQALLRAKQQAEITVRENEV